MNVFSEMVHSVYDTKCYGQFLRDKKGKTFLFGFLLVMFYFLITIMVPFTKFQLSRGGVVNLINEAVPDFTIENRTVTVARPVEYQEGNTYIFVDTDVSLEDSRIEGYLRNYGQVVILDRERAVVKSSGQTQEIVYRDMDSETYMTKDRLLQKISPVITVVLAAGLLIIFVGMELLFFFGVLFVGLLGMIVASCMQYPLTFGQLYKLGIYTRTTPLMIKAVMSFLPFGIPFYTVISIGISLLYLSGGIRNMKTPPLTGGPLVFSSDHTGPLKSGEQDPRNPWDSGQGRNE